MGSPDQGAGLHRGTPSADQSAELRSQTVLVRAPQEQDQDQCMEGGLFINGTEEMSLGALDVARLWRERSVIIADLNTLKAKFEVTIEALRSILQLGVDATWADVLERTQALAEGCFVDGLVANGGTDEAARECEQLEEKVEEQRGHICRLRELLQKQQCLLDMTAKQITGHEQQLEEQQERMSQKDMRIEELSRQVQQEKELSQQRVERQLEAERQLCLREQALAAREAELKKSKADVDKQKAEADRQRAQNKELVATIAEHEIHVDRMRAQLQVHEAAERRRHSYHPNGAPATGCAANGGTGGSSVPVVTTESKAAEAADDRPRLPRPGTGPPMASPGTGRRATSAGSTGGPPAGTGSTSAPGSVTDKMDVQERDAFLSHFPMASRTERILRNRLEERKTKKQAPH